jgi:hypothetical protein
MPRLGKAPARAIFRHAKIRHARIVQHQAHLGFQARAPFFQIGMRVGVAEIDLVDDGQNRNLEQDRVQPRAFDFDRDFAGMLALSDVDASFGQVKQAQEIDEIALDEAQPAQVIQFLVAKAQLAQVVNLRSYLVHVRTQVHAGRAALVPVFHLRGRKMMEDHLHHAELVQVGV